MVFRQEHSRGQVQMKDCKDVNTIEYLEFTERDAFTGVPCSVDAAPAMPETPVQVNVQAVPEIHYPIDKAGKDIWNKANYSVLEDGRGDGHIRANYNIAPARARKKIPEALVYFDISFDELEGMRLSRELNLYDKMVYIAVAALFNAGNTVITTNQVYRIMGGKNKANSSDRRKIMDSLQKMANTRIEFNDEHAQKQFKKDTYFRYQGHLLEARFGERVSMNGIPVADAVRILAEPPMLTFAKHLKQFTTMKPQVFALPLANTDVNLAIKDYLLVNLAFMKSGRRNHKVLWTSLYEACGVTRNKDRVRNAVIKCLDYLQSDAGCNYIMTYTVLDDGITISS